ncbi:hypothetical protein FPZ24_02185 [Sphingomonas panacisoli]|uniref:Uncharacterized protein n=1 Tax=Sphingomonas panacisoli TaxID=1813879 RepID=A0A5B8LGZ4_9SPHN|nr:hypothetical protein [Sphingomonas panacisoli]QDZ06430.1 hypothetical protein FPZ24_02185 [Sphingomonas panacisoli]
MTALSGEKHLTVAYRRWLISPNDIVFDVWRLAPDGSMADMDRQLFKAAEALKGRPFDHVVLAYHGVGRFMIDGAHFGVIGDSWSYQNPIFIVRTLPENVSDMTGKPAFETWTGGLLGVVSQQMEDHNKLHEQWYLRAEAGLTP